MRLLISTAAPKVLSPRMRAFIPTFQQKNHIAHCK
jgi:hypothetical protein